MNGAGESGETGEPMGSTRVEEPGRVWCKCDDRTHTNHMAPDRCGELAHTNDGYCRECERLRGGSTSAVD